MSVIEDEFNAAVNIIQNLPQEGVISIDPSLKLSLYGWYKIATEGDNTTEKPPLWHLQSRTKWHIWNDLNGTCEIEAKEKYVLELKKLLKHIFKTQDISKILESDMSFTEKIPKKDIQIILNGIKTEKNLSEKERTDILKMYTDFFKI